MSKAKSLEYVRANNINELEVKKLKQIYENEMIKYIICNNNKVSQNNYSEYSFKSKGYKCPTIFFDETTFKGE